MAFADDETGIETSQPREFYDVVHGATYYYVASGDRDLSYQGRTYTAIPTARMDLQINPASVMFELVLVLPATHALPRRFLAMGGVPPQQIVVTAYRMQTNSGEVKQFHTGQVTSMGMDGHLAKFAIPNRTGLDLDRTLPSVLFDGSCANVLYDQMCGVDKATYTRSVVAGVVDGKTVTVDSSFVEADNWAQFGELLHVPSGERMTITLQVGKVITMQYPLYELHAGDAVQVIAGCAHNVATCNSKFSNKDNFTGAPNRPTRDLYMPTGVGILEYI